jgi:hypothetical protein
LDMSSRIETNVSARDSHKLEHHDNPVNVR